MTASRPTLGAGPFFFLAGSDVTTPPIPTHIPHELTPGDSWTWQLAFGDYPPSDGWTLTVSLRGPSAVAPSLGEIDIEAEATPDNGAYMVSARADQTAQLVPGNYRWVASVARVVGSQEERVSVHRGVTILLQQLQTADAGDTTTHNERMLAAIEALIEGRTTADVEYYQIAGRALTKIPVKELMGYRAKYAAAVWRERHPHETAPARMVSFR